MTAPAPSYSSQEVARRLGVSLQTVQRWVDSGRLAAWKTPGGHRRIDVGVAERLFAELGSAALAAAPAAPEARPPRVVLVDDDPIDRTLMAAHVTTLWPDAEVLQADNGFQGLLLIARQAPDVVVTDVLMPHLDGFEMIRRVLADETTRPRRWVAVSSRDPDELAAFGPLPDGVVLLRKPLVRDAFVAALQGPP